MISISEALHTYAATLDKQWKHDRSKTVGASEIGQCARKTWFGKHDAPRDPDYQESWGARLRGTIMEEAFWEPAVRWWAENNGVQLLFAGKEQRTLSNGFLSATTDGLLVWPDSSCVNLDCKSIDPRVDLHKEKSEHSFQVQTQMGLIRSFTGYNPEISIISYVNASFFDDVKEYVVRFSPRIYAAAQARAEEIMTARDPLELPPEGRLSGGRECAYCAWQSHCSDVTVAGVPTEESRLTDETIAKLKDMRDAERDLAASKDAATEEHARAVEGIKEFLRGANTRRYKGADWSISWSQMTTRATLDMAAVKEAGLDLSPFYKPGKQAERLVVR